MGNKQTKQIKQDKKTKQNNEIKIGDISQHTYATTRTKRLNKPTDIVIDHKNNRYIVTEKNAVRIVNNVGKIYDLPNEEHFQNIMSVTIDKQGIIYIIDCEKKNIYTIKNNKMRYLEGSMILRHWLNNQPQECISINMESNGKSDLLIQATFTDNHSEFMNYNIKTMDIYPTNNGCKDKNKSVESFYSCYDIYGNVIMSDFKNGRIRTINKKKKIETIFKHNELYSPTGLIVDALNNIFVVENKTSIIYKINNQCNKFEVFCGKECKTFRKIIDGVGNEATFNRPQTIKIDLDGNLIVLDTDNGCARCISCDEIADKNNVVVGFNKLKKYVNNAFDHLDKNTVAYVINPIQDIIMDYLYFII